MSGKNPPVIHVLAGVNGAGKSSVGGAMFRRAKSVFYNPDLAAAKIRRIHPGIDAATANGHAWEIGRNLLETAIAERSAFSFETTLGGRTIAGMLESAARSGFPVNVWFVGLESVDLHVHRVAARVAKGGHPIQVSDIRRRWNRSRENLIRLMPHLIELRVFDNSAEADPAKGAPPRPVLLLELVRQRIVAPADLSGTPDWAKSILTAAMKLHQGLPL